MKEKGRYNVRLAQKKGVVVKQFDMKDDKAQDALGVFYNLYQETYKREGITGRSLGYFQNLIDKFSQTDYLKLYISYFEDEPVSASLISECDGMASYLYGGSSRRHKEVMAPYLMHFFAMTEAKSRGCKSYDLIGRSAPGEEKSSWAGLTRFKESFGGEAVEILGSYDFINKKFLYGVFKFIEKIRRKH
jgi:lipid II:glycine glycyltransferase (peptidoglycan interpeptide bridge formation enzyme)